MSPTGSGAATGSAGVTTTEGLGSTISLTVYWTSIVASDQNSVPAMGLVIVTTGAVVSTTVTSCVAVATLPLASVAVHVTVVVPRP
ncbi:MAG: hypothetical protein HN929_02835 [Chloroflexi bacterium]|nr:hypothetical protein [Chloroflexota bacterium]